MVYSMEIQSLVGELATALAAKTSQLSAGIAALLKLVSAVIVLPACLSLVQASVPVVAGVPSARFSRLKSTVPVSVWWVTRTSVQASGTFSRGKASDAA